MKDDSKAHKIFEKQLEIVKLNVEKKPVRFKRVILASDFLEKITGIESEAGGNFFGKEPPTIKDYENWKLWFEQNRWRLIWDEKTKTVLVK